MNVKTREVKKLSLLRRMRIGFAACLLSMFSLTTFSVSAETVRVGHFSWPGYGFLYVAQEKNLSPDLDYEFTVIEDPI